MMKIKKNRISMFAVTILVTLVDVSIICCVIRGLFRLKSHKIAPGKINLLN